MWYKKGGEKELDYSKPIMADGRYLLMPVIGNGSYEIIGYSWFDITHGEWSSCIIRKTPQEAVESYPEYKMENWDKVIGVLV